MRSNDSAQPQQQPRPGPVVFGLVAVGVGAAGLNAIKPTAGLTIGDVAFLLAAGLLLLLVIASRGVGYRVPTWLLIGAGGIALAGLLVELIPPIEPSRAQLYFPGELFSKRGDTGDRVEISNAIGTVRMVSGMLVVPIAIAWAVTSERRVLAIGHIWLAAMGISSIFALLEFSGVAAVLPRGFDESVDESRVAGLTTHPNVFSLTVAMALPLAIIRLLSAVRGWRTGESSGWPVPYYALLLAVLLAGLGVSGSRAGLLAGGLALLVTVILFRPARRLLTLVAALILVAVVARSDIVNLPVFERFSPADLSASSSVDERRTILARTTAEVVDRPIVGHGFDLIRGSHNIYLQLLHAGGLIALISFGIYAIGALVSGWRVALGRSSVDDPDDAGLLRREAVGWVAALTVFLVGGLAQPAILDRFLYVPVGMLIAIAWLAALSEGRERRAAVPAARGRPELAPRPDVQPRPTPV